jgi:hypothetical protein
LAQSPQFTLVGGAVRATVIDVCRQVPAFLNAHHAGRLALVATMSTTISLPETSARGESSTNEHTSCSLWTLRSHANSLFAVPPSS